MSVRQDVLAWGCSRGPLRDGIRERREMLLERGRIALDGVEAGRDRGLSRTERRCGVIIILFDQGIQVLDDLTLVTEIIPKKMK
jgi:hypothetical protein